MAINNNGSDFNTPNFDNVPDNNPDNNSDNWTRAFNQEVAQRQVASMMEQMMAMASQVQQQMQEQMQQRMQAGERDGATGMPAGFGFPGAGLPMGIPQGDVLRDSETALIVSLTLPGLKEESVKIEVKDQQLRVTGEVDAAAMMPPGFPMPPTLGFTRILGLPVAVEGDRPTVTTTETGISIILPKVEPGTLTEEELRQMATPPMGANPMAGIVEALIQGMPVQAGRGASAFPGFPFPPNNRRGLSNTWASWQASAKQTVSRWGKSIEQWLEQVTPAQGSDRTAEFTQKLQLHDQLTARWTEGRKWVGKALQNLGDRLSQ